MIRSFERSLRLYLIAPAIVAGAIFGSPHASAVTVALTTTTAANATAADKQLVSNLLDLMQVEAGRYEELEIVERQQLDLAIHELVFSNMQSEATTLQLGKLAAADLILTAKLLAPAKSGMLNLQVRITESQTAVIRGETLVPIRAEMIEDTATEIVDYLRLVSKEHDVRLPTIAVLPFESAEQFDRLRPLERGLRDLFMSSLIQHKRFRVVQRMSMEQLLIELELLRTGLTGDGQGLEHTSPRETVYVLRGEIDEQILTSGNLVEVRAEMVDPRSQQIVATANRISKPAEVASAASEIAVELSNSVLEATTPPSATNASDAKEIDRLYELALRDVLRFVRYEPDDYGYLPFKIPGVPRPSHLLPQVDPDSPLGVALLEKSIDRLESVLFIQPERLAAALPLAYCLSFHVDGVWRPNQCEALLRRVIAESHDREMRKEAARLLGDMYFTHKGNYSVTEAAKTDAEMAQLGFERRSEALSILVGIGHEAIRPSMLNLLEKLSKADHQDERWASLLQTLENIVEQGGSTRQNSGFQSTLARETSSTASEALRSKQVSAATKRRAEALLLKWSKSEQRWRWLFAARALITAKCGDLTLEEFNTRLDQLFADVKSPFEQQTLTEQKTWIAIHLRDKNEIAKALHILESFDPKDQSGALGHDFTYSEYGYQLARCYEDLGRNQEALDAYMHYVQMPSRYWPRADFISRINRLGGVPLRPDAEIEVRYLDLAPGEPFFCRVLAADRERLYCAGGFTNNVGAPRGTPIRSIRVLDFDSGQWSSLGGPDDRVSCLAVADDYLWAGTDHLGLWRMNIATKEWRQWSLEAGLPTNSVVSVAAVNASAYASVANLNQSGNVISGGMIRVSDAGIHIYRDKHAPTSAPTALTVDSDGIVAVSDANRLHILDRNSDQWTAPPQIRSTVAAAGQSGLWMVPREQLAMLVSDDFKTLRSFEAAGQLPGYHAPSNNFRPKFILEHDGNLWIGGEPWRRFGDCGLFRLSLDSGKLTRYGPREGLRYDEHDDHICYSGVWAVGRLWVATSFGLAEISMKPAPMPNSPERPDTTQR